MDGWMGVRLADSDSTGGEGTEDSSPLDLQEVGQH